MQAPFSGIVRVAVLPHPWDKDSEDILHEHAYAYPRGGKVEFSIDGDDDEMEMRCGRVCVLHTGIPMETDSSPSCIHSKII